MVGLLWLLLQGSKVTSVPITEAVAEVLAPGVERKLLGKPGLQPHPSLHSSWERVASLSAGLWQHICCSLLGRLSSVCGNPCGV